MGIRDARRAAHNNLIAKSRLRAQRAYRLRERGYTPKEIGEALGMSESAVRNLFSK